GTPIPVGADPNDVAITPDGATAYVTNNIPSGSGTVTPIHVATNTPGPPIPVGSGPNLAAITPAGATGYVANISSNDVTPIDVATNTPGTPIPVGSGPVGVAITPDQAPVAKLSVTPGFAGQPTTFDASASTVRFGTITSYAWDFGDGTAP